MNYDMLKAPKSSYFFVSEIRNLKNTTRGVSTRAGVERIFRMVSLLQNASKSGKKITCTSLQEEFEVDRATMLRDIRFICERLEVDLDWDAREGTYVIEENLNPHPRL